MREDIGPAGFGTLYPPPAGAAAGMLPSMDIHRLASRAAVAAREPAANAAANGVPNGDASGGHRCASSLSRGSRPCSARCLGTPRVVAGGNFATPWRALAVLDGAVASYRLFVLNAQAGMPDRDGVTLESPFVGPGMRGLARLRYFPCRLSLVPALLAGPVAPDVVLVQASAPAGGRVSLGTEVNVLPAAIEAVRARGGLVVAQLNPRVPYTYGDAELPCEVIDYAIEAEAPLPSPPRRQATEAAAVIGDRVAALIGDGATLQAGIGAVPDAVLAGLHARRGLTVWSEMFSDGVLGLAKAGALDAAQPVTASFAFGSADLYAWLDRNPDVRMLRTETVNDPALIARRPCDGLGQRRPPGRPVRPGQRHLGERARSTRGSAARPTSSSVRCTRQAARRSSRCRPGIRRRACPPSCHGSTVL